MKLTKDEYQQPHSTTQTSKKVTRNHKTGKGGGISLVMCGDYLITKLNKDTTYKNFEHAVWS